jgi:hypothetical protein
MGYVNVYKAGWSSLKLGGYVYIDKDGGTGPAVSLKLDRDSIEIAYAFDDWNNPVIGLTAAFSIRNDQASFFTLLPLMTATEREYKVRIVVTQGIGSPYTIFEGFLNCDAVSQKYLLKQAIRLTASSYLSKLEYITVPDIDILQNITPIAIIDQMLTLIGHNFNIRINSKLYARGDSLGTGHTLFDVNEFFTEVFWEDNVTRKDALYILKSILTSFNCYIYWYDGYWWIERYEDIWQTPSVDFVEYQSGGGSSFDAGGKGDVVAVSRVSTDLQLFKFAEMTQELNILPGYKNIEIQLNDNLYNTLMNPNLTGMANVQSGWPVSRVWNYTLGKYPTYDDPLIWTTSTFGQVIGAISNAASMEIPDSFKGKRLGIDIEDYKWQSKVIVTTFKCTVQSEMGTNKTTLSIKFKWHPYGPTPYEAGNDSLFTDPYVTGFKLRWYLFKNPSGVNCDFICKTPGGDQWQIITGGEEDGYQTLSIDKSEFTKINNYTYEVNLSIPLSEVMANSSEGTLEGDQTFTFALCLPGYTYWHDLLSWGGEIITPFNVWGDFTTTVTDIFQNNVITGIANTSFLNKKTIELDLFDIDNLNYKNGVYQNNSIARTVDWTDDGVNYFSLVDRLLKEQFRLFNSNRQVLVGDVIYAGRLQPCQLFIDSKQSNKPFVLMGFSYFPMSDKYTVSLYEYDNTTAVNLI